MKFVLENRAKKVGRTDRSLGDGRCREEARIVAFNSIENCISKIDFTHGQDLILSRRKKA